MLTYDPKGILATFGHILIQGWMDGTFIRVEYDEDGFTKHVGADGLVTRIANANESASVVITLSQSALANALLSEMHNRDRRRGDRHAPFQLKDARGTTLVRGDDAWIRKAASIEFAKEATGREWTIDIAQAIIVVGNTDDIGRTPI